MLIQWFTLRLILAAGGSTRRVGSAIYKKSRFCPFFLLTAGVLWQLDLVIAL